MGAPLYPLFIDLCASPVLVVGGGAVAARKVAALLKCGAAVTVISPVIEQSIERARGPEGKARIMRREFRMSDIRRQRLIIAATHDPAMNRRIAKAARRAGILVNVAAPPEAGDVQIPAVIHRGSLCVAISTGGASAALSAAWRERLETIIGAEWIAWVKLLETSRRRILREIKDEQVRRKLLQNLGSLRWGARVKKIGIAKVRAEVSKLIKNS